MFIICSLVSCCCCMYWPNWWSLARTIARTSLCTFCSDLCCSSLTDLSSDVQLPVLEQACPACRDAPSGGPSVHSQPLPRSSPSWQPPPVHWPVARAQPSSPATCLPFEQHVLVPFPPYEMTWLKLAASVGSLPHVRSSCQVLGHPVL